MKTLLTNCAKKGKSFFVLILLTILVGTLVFFISKTSSKPIKLRDWLIQAKSSHSPLVNQKAISLTDDLNDNLPIKTVLILCPPCVTGGPENLCQMAHAFSENGIDTYMLWWTDESFLYKEKNADGKMYLHYKSQKDLTPERYKTLYGVKPLPANKKISLDSSTLVIIPEVTTDATQFFLPSRVVVSWLSLTNFFKNENIIFKKLIDHNKLHHIDCLHFAQTQWIEKQLLKWGVKPISVYDYVSNKYREPLNVRKEDKSIAYFPTKGGDLAASFKKLYPDYHFKPIKDMTMDEVRYTLKSSQIYIDFGHFPGCDRVPREALLSDCVIFIHNEGCATDRDSFPVDDYFRFNSADVENGELAKKINESLLNYKKMQDMQKIFRDIIMNEPTLFKQQIKDFVKFYNDDKAS